MEKSHFTFNLVM